MNIEELENATFATLSLKSLIEYLYTFYDNASWLKYTLEYINFMMNDINKEIKDYKKCNPEYEMKIKPEKFSLEGETIDCLIVGELLTLERVTSNNRNRTEKIRKWVFIITWFIKEYFNTDVTYFDEYAVKGINQLYKDLEKEI